MYNTWDFGNVLSLEGELIQPKHHKHWIAWIHVFASRKKKYYQSTRNAQYHQRTTIIATTVTPTSYKYYYIILSYIDTLAKALIFSKN